MRLVTHWASMVCDSLLRLQFELESNHQGFLVSSPLSSSEQLRFVRSLGSLEQLLLCKKDIEGYAAFPAPIVGGL